MAFPRSLKLFLPQACLGLCLSAGTGTNACAQSAPPEPIVDGLLAAGFARLALDCVQVAGQSLDPQEDIVVHRRPLADALAPVRAGTTNAATSVSGLLLADAALGERRT